MAAINLRTEYHFSSGVFSAIQVQVVYEALKSGSAVFRDILSRIPQITHSQLGGEILTGIVFTDEWSRLGVSTEPANPAASLVEDGKLVVYLSPQADVVRRLSGANSSRMPHQRICRLDLAGSAIECPIP